ncbi:helix-turn-helix transcriptional regulator [Nitratireductor mangrovi]|uniref:Helix-turn-helix transcriptional regulator n=1 Tax=Nitratireductor mangrovi TaxID=2599600 RepID=A0A5B8L3Q7_9HYPH|nr:AraC family transcriptional regulator [Nitratireductor mangrovi]QDZ02535.1 helix-turn-helix transcriptional regulator [Nitratireductor mangrovi]
MGILGRELATGDGWYVKDIVCDPGPNDRPFEEQHANFCVALVSGGSFRYRSSTGEALLAPGAMLFGRQGACFECGHDHSVGDRCISFHFSGDYIEETAREVAGARGSGFARAALPPGTATARLASDLAVAAEDDDRPAFAELALRVASAALAGAAADRMKAPTAREERAVSAALQRIEADVAMEVSLAALAEEARLSRFHFLRVFRQVTGTTPYQYLLLRRLHRAAAALRHGRDGVAAIAYDAGFGDLSTFNRRFRRVFGVSPSTLRRAKPAA